MARTNTHSKDKYQELIKNELNVTLRKLSDPRLLLCSITKVELNRDYSVAKVFWDTFNDDSTFEIGTALDGASGKVRSVLAKVLKLRHIPVITFAYDSQFSDELKITELLKETRDGQ